MAGFNGLGHSTSSDAAFQRGAGVVGSLEGDASMEMEISPLFYGGGGSKAASSSSAVALQSRGASAHPVVDGEDLGEAHHLVEVEEDVIEKKPKHKWTKAQVVLIRATVLAAIFMCLEVVGGYISESVSIISDAAHMFSDVSGYIIALAAAYLSTLGGTKKYPYGYKRVEVLGALLSVVLIWIVTLWLVAEAIHRLIHPEEVKEKVMVTTAALGIVFNVCIFWVLGAQNHHHFGMPCNHGHSHSHSHSHGGSDEDDVSALHSGCSHHGHGHEDKLVHRRSLSSEADDGHIHPQQHEKGAGHHGHGHSHEDGESCKSHHGHHGHQHGAKETCSSHHGHGHGHQAADPCKDHHGHGHHGHKAEDSCKDHHGHGHHGHGHGHKAEEPCNAHHGHEGGKPCNGHGHHDKEDKEAPMDIFANTTSHQAAAPSCHGHGHHGVSSGHCGSHGDDPGDCTQDNLNIRGAVLHALGDLLQSIGVLIAGIVMWVVPSWWWADPVATLLFSVIVFWTTRPLIIDITDILMQRAPSSVSVDALEKELMAIPGVESVYKLSVWSLSSDKHVMSAHVKVKHGSRAGIALRAMENICSAHKIKDTTIQVEQA